MLTIEPTELSAIRLFDAGTEAQRKKHQEGEGAKIGTLRGGSSGALVNGDPIGKCHRASLARFLGFQEQPSSDSYAFFDAGFSSEWVWENKLKESWRGTILCEEEIPITWTVPDSNVLVTGRPDIVLCEPVDEDEKFPQLSQYIKGRKAVQSPSGEWVVPVLGLELKAILAVNSAIGVAVEGQPKTDHLIQAAHYSWQMGIPWILVYSWNVKGPVPYWAKKKFGVDEITPGKREFRLGWEEGKLYYTTEAGDRVDTVITQQSIVDYYRLIVDMAEKKDLYRDHSNRDVDGRQLPWSHEKYCSYCKLASQSRDFDEWLDRVRLLSEEGV